MIKHKASLSFFLFLFFFYWLLMIQESGCLSPTIMYRCLPFLRNSIRKKIQVKQEYLQQQEQYQQQLQQQLLLLQQQLQLLNQQREQSQVQEQASIQNQAQEQAQEQVQELPQQEIRREEPLLITRPFYNTIQRRPTPFPTETTSEEGTCLFPLPLFFS